MSLVNPSNLIGCGGDIEQSEPIRNKVGAWRGCGGVWRGHGGSWRGCRGGMEGCRGVQRGDPDYNQPVRWRAKERGSRSLSANYFTAKFL